MKCRYATTETKVTTTTMRRVTCRRISIFNLLHNLSVNCREQRHQSGIRDMGDSCSGGSEELTGLVRAGGRCHFLSFELAGCGRGLGLFVLSY
jgi:hypothetical protein